VWDKENDRRGRVRQYLKDGTVKKFNSAGRPLPSGDMTTVNSLLLKLNHRQRVVYRGMVLDDPPRSRGEIARELGIRHRNQVSEILKQAQTKMNKWLLGKEQKTK
jgi:hypothetical protein